MSPFAQSTMTHAQRCVDDAISHIEEYFSEGHARDVGDAHLALVLARSALTAVQRLEDMIDGIPSVDASIREHDYRGMKLSLVKR